MNDSAQLPTAMKWPACVASALDRSTAWSRYPLEQLMGALQRLFPKHAPTKQHHGRHVLFEYVMLQGINDSLEDAGRLLLLTDGIECKFNLIGFNPHPGTRFRPSSVQQVCNPHRFIYGSCKSIATVRPHSCSGSSHCNVALHVHCIKPRMSHHCIAEVATEQFDTKYAGLLLEPDMFAGRPCMAVT